MNGSSEAVGNSGEVGFGSLQPTPPPAPRLQTPPNRVPSLLDDVKAMRQIAADLATGLESVIERLETMGKALARHDELLASDIAASADHATQLHELAEAERKSKVEATTAARDLLGQIMTDIHGG